MTIIYTDELELNTDELELNTDGLEKIGSGREANVYRFGEHALKIYKNNTIVRRLDDKDVDYLKKIETKRILLPKVELYNEQQKFVGYYTRYIEKMTEASFYKANLSKMIEKLYLLKDDVITLSDGLVKIDDLIWENIVFNDGLFLVDPGDYRIYNDTEHNDKEYNRILHVLNMHTFNDFISSVLVHNLATVESNRLVVSKAHRQITKEFDTSGCPSMVEYLECSNCSNINDFVMRKIKQAKEY